jgi:hypothetical protein
MLSLNPLHGAEADRVLVCQHSLGRTSQELTDERLHVCVSQSVSHAPDARSETAHGNDLAIRLLPVSLASFQPGFR